MLRCEPVIGRLHIGKRRKSRAIRCIERLNTAVSPLGVINDTENSVKVLFDVDIMEQKRIGVHPNENTSTVFIDPKELFDFIKAQGNEISLIEV